MAKRSDGVKMWALSGKFTDGSPCWYEAYASKETAKLQRKNPSEKIVPGTFYPDKPMKAKQPAKKKGGRRR